MVDITNSSLNTIIGFTGTQTIASVIPLIVIVSLLLGVLLAAYSSEWFKRFYKTFAFLGMSLNYFLRGVFITAIIACAYWLFDQLSRMTSDGTIPWEYFVYAVVGYIAMSIVGWYATVVYDSLKSRNKTEARKK